MCLQKFDTYFGLKLSHLLFSATEQTSTTLQRKDLSVQEASTCLQCTINYLRGLRNDESCDQFYATAIISANGQTGVPSLPLYRRPPKRWMKGLHLISLACLKNITEILFDLLIGEISDQLAQDSLDIPIELENLLIL